MGQVIVDNIDLLEPNLRIPGKKPVGQVKVDRNHPLGRHVTAMVIDGIGVDIGTNERYMSYAKKGPNTFYTTTPNNNYSSKVDQQEIGTFITKVKWLAGYTNWSGSEYGYYVSATDNQATSTLLNTGSLYVHARKNSGSTLNIGPRSLDTFYVIALAFDSKTGNFYRVYEDGSFNSQNTFYGTPPLTPDSRKVFAVGDPANAGKCVSEYQIMFDKLLSDSEIRNMYADPYQFLIPSLGAGLRFIGAKSLAGPTLFMSAYGA